MLMNEQSAEREVISAMWKQTIQIKHKLNQLSLERIHTLISIEPNNDMIMRLKFRRKKNNTNYE